MYRTTPLIVMGEPSGRPAKAPATGVDPVVTSNGMSLLGTTKDGGVALRSSWQELRTTRWLAVINPPTAAYSEPSQSKRVTDWLKAPSEILEPTSPVTEAALGQTLLAVPPKSAP